MNKKVIAQVLAVFIPVILIIGIVWFRLLGKNGVQIMPYAVGLCGILTILFFLELSLLKKSNINILNFNFKIFHR